MFVIHVVHLQGLPMFTTFQLSQNMYTNPMTASIFRLRANIFNKLFILDLTNITSKNKGFEVARDAAQQYFSLFRSWFMLYIF